MPRIKRKILKLRFILKPTLIVGIFSVSTIVLFRILSPVYQFLDREKMNRAFFESLILNKESSLKSFQGRTNVLLLGIPGGNHDGSDLTDTMILLSTNIAVKDGIMVSIPRDIWLDSLKEKINSAYHYGEEKRKGGGIVMAKAVAEEVVGQPVHYAWVIDFSGFQRLIDMIGGVDVNVENSFIDNEYPITGKENDPCGGDPEFKCRFEKLEFTKGKQHMDGARVLKFVRSRHAQGDEGTDFARGKRQQLVMEALKNKVMSPAFIKANLTKLPQLFSAFDDTTDTDMNLSEQILFLKSFVQWNDRIIRKLVLDDGDAEKGRKGFLVNPPLEQSDGEWILLARTGNFDEIHKFIQCQFENPACEMKP